MLNPFLFILSVLMRRKPKAMILPQVQVCLHLVISMCLHFCWHSIVAVLISSLTPGIGKKKILYFQVVRLFIHFYVLVCMSRFIALSSKKHGLYFGLLFACFFVRGFHCTQYVVNVCYKKGMVLIHRISASNGTCSQNHLETLTGPISAFSSVALGPGCRDVMFRAAPQVSRSVHLDGDSYISAA